MFAQVLKGLEYHIVSQKPIEYRCYCSRERVEEALRSVGEEELEKMIAEGKEISVSCQFCDRCDRVRLTADGRIKPCLHQQSEYPIKGLDEDGMLRQFEAAIRSKPPWHGELSYAAPSRAGRSMNRIGG